MRTVCEDVKFIGTIGVAIFALAASPAFSQTPPAQRGGRGEPPSTAQAQQVTWEHGTPPAVMVPSSDKHPTVFLWPNGAPGSEGKTEDETHRLSGDLLIVSNVHRPSITVYLPAKEKATGAGVIVAPGGGFSELWITDEGYRVGDWLSQRGIAAFILKWRLPNAQGSTYTLSDHSVPDIQRAIRLVRSRAAEWRVDPDRIGVLGFSAGGILAGLAGARFSDPVKQPVDSVDRLSAKPAFMGLIYGTPFTPPVKQEDRPITKDFPPLFLCAGSSDPVAVGYPDVFKQFKEAGVPVELHMFAGIGHGFALQLGEPAVTQLWPDLFRAWLFERGLLTRQ
jgi:acetyl esterase/lipase